jgi:transitional endoplasmic reticulum ATPase
VIDEIDAIAAVRNGFTHSSSIVAQLLVLMDGLESRGNVVVLATTSNPNKIDPALRRPGRFDKEVELNAPDEKDRVRLLEQLLTGVDHPLDIKNLASLTNGYVVADLSLLVRQTLLMSTDSIREPAALLESLSKMVVARSGGRFDSNLSWDSLGGLHRLKAKIQESIINPILRRAELTEYGMYPPRGVLLYGPPGCSKTSIVKVMASTTGFAFYGISSAEIFSPMLGESEETIRSIFRKARRSTPCFIFFDELDAIVSNRSISSSDTVQDRVLSTLLNEMDGITAARDVIVLVCGIIDVGFDEST